MKAFTFGQQRGENEMKRKGKLKYVNGVKHASYGIGLGPIALVSAPYHNC